MWGPANIPEFPTKPHLNLVSVHKYWLMQGISNKPRSILKITVGTVDEETDRTREKEQLKSERRLEKLAVEGGSALSILMAQGALY